MEPVPRSPTLRCHPAKAGIQYSAASPGLPDRPLSRATTRLCDSIRAKFALISPFLPLSASIHQPSTLDFRVMPFGKMLPLLSIKLAICHYRQIKRGIRVSSGLNPIWNDCCGFYRQGVTRCRFDPCPQPRPAALRCGPSIATRTITRVIGS